MDLTAIEQIIISAVPAVTAIIGIIVALIKMLGQFEQLKASFKASTDIKDLKAQLKQMNEENIALRKQVRKLLNKMDNILDTEDEQ